MALNTMPPTPKPPISRPASVGPPPPWLIRKSARNGKPPNIEAPSSATQPNSTSARGFDSTAR